MPGTLAEYLASAESRGTGGFLCLFGPSGVGKTSPVEAVARALRRRVRELSCGGLRDGTDLRSNNRVWRKAQPR